MPITAAAAQLGLQGLGMVMGGFQAMGNRQDQQALLHGAGQIRDEQIGFLDTGTGIRRDTTDLGRSQAYNAQTSAVENAQLSYDNLVGSQNLGYEQGISDIGFQMGDLNVSTGQAVGNIMQQRYGNYAQSGLARSGAVDKAYSTSVSDLTNKYKTSTDKLMASRDFLGKRKDLAIGQAGSALDLTKTQSMRQRNLALAGLDIDDRSTDLAYDQGLAGIEQEYQGRVTDAEGMPTTFLEGFFG